MTLISGALLWSVATMVSGGREPWDTSAYWTGFFPFAVLLSGALGFAFPARVWRWPLGVMLMQLPVMTLLGGSGLGLWPLGILLLLVLAIPGIVAAYAGAAARRWAGA